MTSLVDGAHAALSNRERVERHTGDGTCGEGCHSSFINPAGFAFEHYDGLGRWQSQDLGGPINSTATMVIDGQQVTYSGATQFAEILANSPQVHGCYVESLLRHTWARELDDADAPVVERMTRASLQGASTLSLVDQAVTSEAFTCNR